MDYMDLINYLDSFFLGRMDAPDIRSPERVEMDTKPWWHEILGKWFHIRGRAAIPAALVGERMDTTVADLYLKKKSQLLTKKPVADDTVYDQPNVNVKKRDN